MNEKDLCDQLIKQATAFGFDYYPEYAGWDILLTYRRMIFGVQAKMDLNIKLLSQAVELGGVHFHVVLFDTVSDKKFKEFSPILEKLKLLPLTVISRWNDDTSNSEDVLGPPFYFNYNWHSNWLMPYLHRPKKLIEIPDFHYDTPAGVRSPRQVSQHNINLVKLELMALKQNEYVSLAQIRAHGFRSVPKYYYEYDWNRKLWRLRPPKWRASKDYPHIAEGLAKNVLSV